MRASPTNGTRRLGRSEKLMSLSAGLGLLHHIDHVLRSDHSGWPFKPAVTPFTFSLLVYPVFVWAFYRPQGSWARFFGILLIFLFTQGAHTFLETPYQQYCAWAKNASCSPASPGLPNLLGWQSPATGVLAVGVSLGLSLALLLTCGSLFVDARNQGRKKAAASER